LFKAAGADDVLTVHGGTGANNMVITALVEPTDNVAVITPNYQQHYAIPESLGAEVRILHLDKSNDYKLDLAALASLVDAYMPSIVDLYEKGISTGSKSKVFSMAGTRVGWIVTRCKEAHDILENRRSYDTICDGPLDELLAAVALEHKDKLLARSRQIVRTSRTCPAARRAWEPPRSSITTSMSAARNCAPTSWRKPACCSATGTASRSRTRSGLATVSGTRRNSPRRSSYWADISASWPATRGSRDDDDRAGTAARHRGCGAGIPRLCEKRVCPLASSAAA
jgi:hypothetical protein